MSPYANRSSSALILEPLKTFLRVSLSLGWAFWLPFLAVECFLGVFVIALLAGSIIVAGTSLVLANGIFVFMLGRALSGKLF